MTRQKEEEEEETILGSDTVQILRIWRTKQRIHTKFVDDAL